MARVLGRVRLSRVTDESTSVERQTEAIEKWASSQGHEIIGWATDLDFSRSVKPFDAPYFGPWLKDPEKVAQWDIVVAWRVDRFGAGLKLAPLYQWCLDNDKDLICTTQPFNLRTTEGRIIANVLGEIAQGEWEAAQERRLDTTAYLRSVGRWGGGQPPYHYEAVKRGSGYTLVLDPYSADITRGIIRDFLDGKPVETTAVRLTDEGVLTPLDYYRKREKDKAEDAGIEYRGKKPEGRRWKSPTIWKLLQSQFLLGYQEHEGSLVRDEGGDPVRFGDPLITQTEYDRIQVEVKRRQAGKFKRERNTGPLLGIVQCAVCDGPIHHTTKRMRYGGKEHTYRYYRCPVKGHGNQIRAEALETLIHGVFLNMVGKLPRLERVYIPAEDHTAEIGEAERAVAALLDTVEGLDPGPVLDMTQARLGARSERLRELKAMPKSEARTELRETGANYQDEWDRLDEAGRRNMILDSGIMFGVSLSGRVTAGKTVINPGQWTVSIKVPSDVRARLDIPDVLPSGVRGPNEFLRAIVADAKRRGELRGDEPPDGWLDGY